MIGYEEVKPAKPNGAVVSHALPASAHGIDLSLIRADGGTQSRATLYQDVVDEYATAIGDGASFPPVVVFYDGKDHWLADGFHRYHAHAKLGLVEIEADVRQGTRRDAILYSVGANETHGLRRTNDDKRRAVQTLLGDAEWAEWSDREIARRCLVNHEMVGRMRTVLTGGAASEPRTYKTKHGTTAKMKTSAIGKAGAKSPAKEPMEAELDKETAARVLNTWVKIVVPDGEDIADLCRRGLALEAKGELAEKAAAEVGLARDAYRRARQIVLLADNQDLSAKDSETAKQALDVLKDALLTRAWEIAEPLVNRVFGKGSKTDLVRIAAKRLEQFDRTFGIVMQSCTTTDEIDLPYLSAERVKKAVRDIGAARAALKTFSDRLKDIHG